MLKDIERKKKLLALRVRLMENMKFMLNFYKFTEEESCIDFVKELGRDSEKVKKEIEKLK